MCADLRKEALGAVLGRLAKENSAEAEAAADGLFQDTQAFYGAISGFGKFGTRKRLAKLLD